MAGCWWPWPRRCRKGGDAGDGRKGGDAGDGRKGGDACQCCQGCQPCQSCQSQSSPDATGESLTAWHCEPMQPRWDTFKSRFNLQLQGNVELVHLVKDPFLGKWWKILAEGLLLSMVPLMNLPIIYKVIWSRQSPEVLTDKEVCDGNLDDFCSFQLLQTSSPQSCVIVEIWNSTWCRMNILLSFVVIVIHFIHIISIQYIQYIQIECLQTWHSTRSRLLAIESSSTGFDTFRIVPEATTMLGRGYPFPKAADFHRFRRKKTHTRRVHRQMQWMINYDMPENLLEYLRVVLFCLCFILIQTLSTLSMLQFMNVDNHPVRVDSQYWGAGFDSRATVTLLAMLWLSSPKTIYFRIGGGKLRCSQE